MHGHDYVQSRMKNGLDAQAVIAELISIGWHPESAKTAVDGCLSGVRSPSRSPGPDLSHLPSSLSLDGREVLVQLRMFRPSLCLLSGFASAEECADVMMFALPRLERSRVLFADEAGDDDGEGVHAYARTSEQAALISGHCAAADALRSRVAALMQWPESHMESTQVARYRPGADFATHHDYLCPVAHRSLIENEGQRVATALVYLSTPRTGGATSFPDIEAEFYPQAGNALVFAYDDASPASRSLHAGVPLGIGEKWIATFFLRDRAVPQAVTRSSE